MILKKRKRIIVIIIILMMGYAGYWSYMHLNFNSSYKIGQPIDSLNGVKVYYNGGIDHVSGRNLTYDNYNLGLKYQCVEFVKRYYFEYLKHKMPDSYGHAVDFFNKDLKDGEKNIKRDLIQYCNPSKSKPKINDLIIMSGTITNKYGHVAIVSNVTENSIEIIQQNPGQFSKSRETFSLVQQDDKWKIKNNRILGWLRKE
jgi:surface antigen